MMARTTPNRINERSFPNMMGMGPIINTPPPLICVLLSSSFPVVSRADPKNNIKIPMIITKIPIVMRF
jgi:hypothetical protein